MRRPTFGSLVLIALLLAGLSACVIDEPAPPQVGAQQTTDFNQTPPPSPATDVVMTQPPPPLREEAMGTAPSVTYVWVPGYWTWNNGWVWTSGHWEVPPRNSVVWVPGQWIQTSRGWTWQPGRWQ